MARKRHTPEQAINKLTVAEGSTVGFGHPPSRPPQPP
jgi:hypothetical protein